MKQNECVYDSCRLPDNNNRYLWQLGYFGISIVYLLFVPGQFTGYGLIMLTFPILVDLWSTDLEGKGLRLLRSVYIVSNIAIFLFGILVTIGVLNDTGTAYAIADDAVFFQGVQLQKRYVAFFLLFDTGVPLVLFFGAPCKKNVVMMTMVKKFSFSSRAITKG